MLVIGVNAVVHPIAIHFIYYFFLVEDSGRRSVDGSTYQKHVFHPTAVLELGIEMISMRGRVFKAAIIGREHALVQEMV